MKTETCVHMVCNFCRMSCGISLGVLTLQDVLDKAIPLTMSMAWQLGRAVRRAQLSHSSVLEAVATQQNGIILINGKVENCLTSPL